ncbi:hypothetical protein F2Q70_00030656 [Brassica cretica]|uniref:Uncharacterized protein n=1 Tax=Brassica cretica TaxID=69181 RepID=A0A8S9FJV7_BRACR|nr:hypothetical protein F2Q70_00030656 [Brassica cretica]
MLRRLHHIEHFKTIAKGPSPIIELYKTARISPLVLTYYGLCLDFKPPVYHDNKRLIISIAVAVMAFRVSKLLRLTPNSRLIIVRWLPRSGLSGAGQADWILRYGLAAVCMRETHAAELLRFV